MEKDAKVTLGAEGAEEVARAADRAMRPWQTAIQNVKTGMTSMGTAVGDTIKSVSSDITRGITAFAAFDFAGRIPSVIQYREEVARLSVVAGKSSQELREHFAKQEAATMQARSSNEQFSRSFGRLTYNYSDATKAAGALADEAIAANRSIGEMSGIGKVIVETTGSIDNAAGALGRMRAQADALGVKGGPDALRDQVEALSNAISDMAVHSEKDLGKVTARFAEMGAGLNPHQQSRVNQQLSSGIMGRGLAADYWYRYTGALKPGESVFDKEGHWRTDVDMYAMEQKAYLKMAHGNKRLAQQYATSQYGPEAAAQLFQYDPKRAATAGEFGDNTSAKRIADMYRTSEEGKRHLAQIQARGKQEDVAGEALPLVDKVLDFARESPVLAGIGALVGPGLVNQGIGWGIGRVGRALAPTGVQALKGRIAAGTAGRAAAAAAGRTAAMEAAAEGGWLTLKGGLGKRALGGLGTVLGIGGEAMSLANPVLNTMAIGGFLEANSEEGRQFKENKAQYLEENQSTISAEREMMARRTGMQASGTTADKAMAAYDSMVEHGASPEEAEALVKALIEKIEVQVTVINQTGGPVAVLNNQGGKKGKQ